MLTFDGRRYGFGHESFFDYCFARLFVSRPQSLVSFLKESVQNLFRRAHVRQVLTYFRDADRDRYLRELASLLSDEGIRTHVKELAFALLAEVTDPAEEEWAIWQEWVAPELEAIEEGSLNSVKLSVLAWRKFFASAPWFAFVDRRGVVESWLESGNERLINLAMHYLNIHHRHSPDRAAVLLEPYTDRAGRAQFALLSAIPEELRSDRVNARFKELERKFGEPEGGPCGIRGGLVGPPIKEDAAEKMTDGQWLRAIAKYRSEDRIRVTSDGVEGGAWQLAQVLEKQAKEEPDRFACLSLRLPVDANPVYLERTLAALKSAAAASDLKLQVCRKAFEESRMHCGQSIADVLGASKTRSRPTPSKC